MSLFKAANFLRDHRKASRHGGGYHRNPPQGFPGADHYICYLLFAITLLLRAFALAFGARPFALALLFVAVAAFCGRCFKAACAAARRAIGTRNGEQET